MNIHTFLDDYAPVLFKAGCIPTSVFNEAIKLKLPSASIVITPENPEPFIMYDGVFISLDGVHLSPSNDFFPYRETVQPRLISRALSNLMDRLGVIENIKNSIRVARFFHQASPSTGH